MGELTFKQLFFRHYDKKIADGTITFFTSGITKEEFTRLCIEDNYVLPKETIERIIVNMHLTDDEAKELREFI